ncbi:MAG: carbonate dehydratase [Longimicrobiales bacterium]
MTPLRDVLANNRAWAARMAEEQPGFFEELAKAQTPEYLWIGCADSRVPANQIMGLPPGQVFVHRNVANVVVHTDLNFLTVLQYAVDVLRVPRVIVCGHYGCGGVQAAWNRTPVGLADNWLRHIEDVAAAHEGELAALPDDAARVRRLCELNVRQQAINVCRTSVIQDAWGRGQAISVHGLIYALDDGLLTDLGYTAKGAADVPRPPGADGG